MKNFYRFSLFSKKRSITTFLKLIGIITIFFISIFLVFNVFISRLIENNVRSAYLAQLLGLEINALWNWQRQNGLNRDLVLGSKGVDVVFVQEILNKLLPDIFPSNFVTGYFGEITARAVLQLQKLFNLTPNGYVDSQTRDLINRFYLKELCPKPPPEIEYPDLSLFAVGRGRPIPYQNYIPPDLVSALGRVRTVGIVCVREETLNALEKMFKAAEEEKVFLAVSSGFRKREIQEVLFNFWKKVEGDKALDTTALPGFSEHQLGTAVDLTGLSINFRGVANEFAASYEGQWLERNAYRYGFVMSYPKSKEEITGYGYEPWHFRYVGDKIAKEIFERGITLYEYLNELEETSKKFKDL